MAVSYSPEDVLAFTKPAKGYCCPLDANTYGVEFLKFAVLESESGRVIYQVSTALLFDAHLAI